MQLQFGLLKLKAIYPVKIYVYSIMMVFMEKSMVFIVPLDP